MARSLKKGFFVDHHLWKFVVSQDEGSKKKVFKTWSRRSTITPEFVGGTFAVHNGKKFIPVYVTENMVVISWVSLLLQGTSPVTPLIRKRRNKV